MGVDFQKHWQFLQQWPKLIDWVIINAVCNQRMPTPPGLPSKDFTWLLLLYEPQLTDIPHVVGLQCEYSSLSTGWSDSYTTLRQEFFCGGFVLLKSQLFTKTFPGLILLNFAIKTHQIKLQNTIYVVTEQPDVCSTLDGCAWFPRGNLWIVVRNVSALWCSTCYRLNTHCTSPAAFR